MNATDTAPLPSPEEVLSFWLGDATPRDWPADDRSALWFGGGPALDRRITARFGPAVHAAQNGGLAEWEATVQDRLALIILLDQFSRNACRGQAAAFAGDARAQLLVQRTLALGQDNALPIVGRVFLYMPLMHAEDLSLQRECVARFEQLVRDSPPELARHLQGNLQAARQHRDIVQRFGRFPHRNAVLDRASTPEEAAFLLNGPRFGQ